MQTDQKRLLEAIANEPDRESAILVYADWLEENQDPICEFVRLQVRYNRTPIGDPVRVELEQEKLEFLRSGAIKTHFANCVDNLVDDPLEVAIAKLGIPLPDCASERESSPELARLTCQPFDFTNTNGMRLLLVPAGISTQGEEATGEISDMFHPYLSKRNVKISKPFHLGVSAVTQSEFERVMGENPSWHCANGEGAQLVEGLDTSKFPVEQVDLFMAVNFCKRLSELESESKIQDSYYLPTQAQWEHGCRAGSQSKYCFGDDADDLDNYCVYLGDPQSQGRRPVEVASKKPNNWGLYDMHGNVCEWCSDRSRRQDELPGEETDPIGDGDYPVNKGGSWDSSFTACAAGRYRGDSADYNYNYYGFRVAYSV